MNNWCKGKNATYKFICPKCGRTVIMKGNYSTECFACGTEMIVVGKG